MSNGNDAKITNAQRNTRKTITLGQPGRTGWEKGEGGGFTANSATSRNWTGWHYVWMRLVFPLMAGKSFRGMSGLFGRIPLAWGSPPPLMMNRAGSAAFLYGVLISLTAELRALLDPRSRRKKRGLSSTLRSPLARFWQRDTSQELHNQMFLLLFLFCPKYNCHSNCCGCTAASRHSPKYYAKLC